MSFATTWIDLEGITLNEIVKQRKTNTVASKKYNKQVNITTTRNRLTDTENKLVVTSGEREMGRGKTGVGD